eukprot:2244323-Prymnesium_polylepis.1
MVPVRGFCDGGSPRSHAASFVKPRWRVARSVAQPYDVFTRWRVTRSVAQLEGGRRPGPPSKSRQIGLKRPSKPGGGPGPPRQIS